MHALVKAWLHLLHIRYVQFRVEATTFTRRTYLLTTSWWTGLYDLSTLSCVACDSDVFLEGSAAIARVALPA